jgi:hypothetical protein
LLCSAPCILSHPKHFKNQSLPSHACLIRVRIIQVHTICQTRCTWKQIAILSSKHVYSSSQF